MLIRDGSPSHIGNDGVGCVSRFPDASIGAGNIDGVAGRVARVESHGGAAARDQTVKVRIGTQRRWSERDPTGREGSSRLGTRGFCSLRLSLGAHPHLLLMRSQTKGCCRLSLGSLAATHVPFRPLIRTVLVGFLDRVVLRRPLPPLSGRARRK